MRIERDEEGGFIFLTDKKVERDVYITEDIVISLDKDGGIPVIEYLQPDWNNLSDKYLLQAISEELQEELEVRKEENEAINKGMMAVIREKMEL